MPTITPTITPTVYVNSISNSSNTFGTFVVDLIEGIVNINAMLILKIVIAWLLFIWFVFSLWVLIDSLRRYKSLIVPVLWFIFVLPFNFLGFLGYFFIRPSYTKDEKQALELDNQLLEYEINNLIICPSCGKTQSLNNKHCYHCGESLRVVCISCKKEMPLNYYYCTYCGTKLPEHKTVDLSNTFHNDKKLKAMVSTTDGNIKKKFNWKSTFVRIFRIPYLVLLWWGQNVYLALNWMLNVLTYLGNATIKAITYPFVLIKKIFAGQSKKPKTEKKIVEKSKKRLSKVVNKKDKETQSVRSSKKRKNTKNNMNKNK